jgi:hypothetical protein
MKLFLSNSKCALSKIKRIKLRIILNNNQTEVLFGLKQNQVDFAY